MHMVGKLLRNNYFAQPMDCNSEWEGNSKKEGKQKEESVRASEGEERM